MTQTETFPDEDQLRLPARWRRHVMPRRGRDFANTDLDTAVDPAASEAVALRIAELRPLIEEEFLKRDEKVYRPAVAARLRGLADPVGAAALMHLLDSTETNSLGYNHTITAAARLRHLDAWIADHGLAFAAVAVLESAMIYHSTYYRDGRLVTIGRIGTHSELQETEGWRLAQPAVNRVRSLLAAAPEAEYREAVAAVDARRTDLQRRIGAAILMPDEADWAEEAVTASIGYIAKYRMDDWMRWSILADPRHLHLVEQRGFVHGDISDRTLAPLVEGLGTAVLPLLTRVMDHMFARMSKPARAALMTAIGLLPSDEAVAYLVDKLELPGALNAVTATAARFPVRTLRVVAARVETAEPAARERLAGLVKSSPALADALDRTDDATRRAIAALTASPDELPAAPAGALPPLLVDPVWKRKRRKQERPVIEGLAPALETRLVWDDPEEERRWATLRDHDPYTSFGEKQEARVLARLEEHGDILDAAILFAWARLEFVQPLLERWDGTARYTGIAELQRILGRFGPPVADRVVALLKGRPALAEAVMPIQSLAAARLAADWLTRSKSVAPIAKRWLARHTAAAAHLLVPDALGPDAAARRAATTTLRYLILTHGAEPVAHAAKEYGDAAAAAIDALIAADPLDPLDAKIPKPPAWAAPNMLPQILLEGREAALPAEAVSHVTTVLALDSPEFPYAGVEVVAEACDRASLTRFSWALFELWTAVGSPAKDRWAFTQLARFADDDTVAELAALIRRWPGDGQHKRAVTGLEVLGDIGTETSLRALHVISRKVRFKALKLEAGKQIETVAERLGLTTEQLADRLVPDFGLDGDTSLVLAYGPRRFTVAFDEQLKPVVSDEDGKPLRSLPRPNADDDAALADAAYERFAQLKRDLRTVAKEQVRRLEHAMVAERSWTVPEFQEFFTDHPLMRHLARRLVWLAESGGEPSGFRIAEDGTFTDAADDRFDLPGDARVRLAHPLRLGDRLAAWAEIFADYELLQPFSQLSRPILGFTEEELRTGRVTRFDGATLKSGSVLGLAQWGWRRGPSNSWWVEPGFHRPLPAGGFVVVGLDPGIDSYEGRVDGAKIQTVSSVHLSEDADYTALGEGGDHPRDIDPLTASEVLGALARITA
ncbi:DUF4132 domain-containing protein [Glycomyces harbinensis]|nr:DUF4132 domain-containing protein [Glycomyces harbinensis]